MGRRRKSRFNFYPNLPEIDPPIKRGIFIVILFLIAIISLFSIFDLAGVLGRYIYQILNLVFGWGFWIFPLVLLVADYLYYLDNDKYYFSHSNWLGMFLLIIGYSGFFHLTQNPDTFKQTVHDGIGGGYIGFAVSYPLFKLMGQWASIAVVIALFFIGIMLMFNTSLNTILNNLSLKSFRDWIKQKRDSKFEDYDHEEDEYSDEDDESVEFEHKEIEQTDDEVQEESEELNEPGNIDGIERPKRRRKYPVINIPIDLLSANAGKPTSGDIEFCQEKIKSTLAHFGIEVEMGQYSVGPTVTQYTFRPAEGVKLSRIIGLSNDLALALAAHPIRIEAPIPGKALVGVEVPNKKIAVVPLRSILESKEFKKRSSNINICMGQDVAGKPWIADLSKLPHLLVAGATNSGKTVCLNSIIISLLYQNQPDDLKLILVDPKRVEMPGYNGIPHLMAPVITDIKKTVNALKWTINEMERRFHVLSNAGKRNIYSYNITHPKNKLPYLVFIIDELADLMSVASAEVEAAIIRLAQMSRAVGIHLILATQRPSVDIITGLIKANIPGRIAFSVASLTDSRTILDVAGAEKLLGRGDMLYSSAEVSKPKRLQGAFCSDQDIENVVSYLRSQAEPDYDDAVTDRTIARENGVITPGIIPSEDDSDEFLDEARELVVRAGKASASYLQRRLRIGYARAARILDLLEDEGTIGPADGSKPREILIKKDDNEIKFENNSYSDININEVDSDDNYNRGKVSDLEDEEDEEDNEDEEEDYT